MDLESIALLLVALDTLPKEQLDTLRFDTECTRLTVGLESVTMTSHSLGYKQGEARESLRWRNLWVPPKSDILMNFPSDYNSDHSSSDLCDGALPSKPNN